MAACGRLCASRRYSETLNCGLCRLFGRAVASKATGPSKISAKCASGSPCHRPGLCIDNVFCAEIPSQQLGQTHCANVRHLFRHRLRNGCAAAGLKCLGKPFHRCLRMFLGGMPVSAHASIATRRRRGWQRFVSSRKEISVGMRLRRRVNTVGRQR